MAKPIFLVKVPYEITSVCDGEHVNNIQKVLEKKLTDYHVLVAGCNVNDLEFQCFFEKDFGEINFEELKSIVSEQFKTKEE